MNDYETEDYSFLLFYIPKEVLESGNVIFDVTIKKMEIDVKKAHEIFEDAIRLLNGDCPKKTCKWCDGR
jgi:hypothetical protein